MIRRMIILMTLVGEGLGLVRHYPDPTAMLAWTICMAIAFALLMVIDKVLGGGNAWKQ